jgi:hypothetical protein
MPIRDDIKAVKRQITQVFTKGTHNAANNDRIYDDEDIRRPPMNDNRHILFFIRVYSFQGQSIEQDPNNPQAINSHIGFLFFDIALLKVYTGLIKGTSKIDQIDRFKSLLMHVKPVECVTIFAEKAH